MAAVIKNKVRDLAEAPGRARFGSSI